MPADDDSDSTVSIDEDEEIESDSDDSGPARGRRRGSSFRKRRKRPEWPFEENIWHSTLRSKNLKGRKFLRDYAVALKNVDDPEDREAAYKQAALANGQPPILPTAEELAAQIGMAPPAPPQPRGAPRGAAGRGPGAARNEGSGAGRGSPPGKRQRKSDSDEEHTLNRPGFGPARGDAGAAAGFGPGAGAMSGAGGALDSAAAFLEAGGGLGPSGPGNLAATTRVPPGGRQLPPRRQAEQWQPPHQQQQQQPPPGPFQQSIPIHSLDYLRTLDQDARRLSSPPDPTYSAASGRAAASLPTAWNPSELFEPRGDAAGFPPSASHSFSFGRRNAAAAAAAAAADAEAAEARAAVMNAHHQCVLGAIGGDDVAATRAANSNNSSTLVAARGLSVSQILSDPAGPLPSGHQSGGWSGSTAQQLAGLQPLPPLDGEPLPGSCLSARGSLSTTLTSADLERAQAYPRRGSRDHGYPLPPYGLGAAGSPTESGGPAAGHGHGYYEAWRSTAGPGAARHSPSALAGYPSGEMALGGPSSLQRYSTTGSGGGGVPLHPHHLHVQQRPPPGGAAVQRYSAHGRDSAVFGSPPMTTTAAAPPPRTQQEHVMMQMMQRQHQQQMLQHQEAQAQLAARQRQQQAQQQLQQQERLVHQMHQQRAREQEAFLLRRQQQEALLQQQEMHVQRAAPLWRQQGPSVAQRPLLAPQPQPAPSWAQQQRTQLLGPAVTLADSGRGGSGGGAASMDEDEPPPPLTDAVPMGLGSVMDDPMLSECLRDASAGSGGGASSGVRQGSGGGSSSRGGSAGSASRGM
ncbi:hypothetical protein GPECTOR_41g631 [Gonium pectorale]|uniref:Uncharacterized protein n=1 Tax=Gonium pectorale TaxID=33097 RepID=A0A150G9Z1_GONPE|nr:hypothetical protein GPECTOR_41g631 [Gonium pectorale]|eukprot:KXZ46667.1 hypothetical protein GPECTOR_41g631 [Gonium pectorale]